MPLLSDHPGKDARAPSSHMITWERSPMHRPPSDHPGRDPCAPSSRLITWEGTPVRCPLSNHLGKLAWSNSPGH